MEEKKLYYRKRFRVPSARLNGWDYTNDGFYFVTICTENKKMVFGEIVEHEMVLNRFGKLADDYWQQIPAHFPQVCLDEYVVMPNHVHGILVVDKDVNTSNHVRRDVAVQRLYEGEFIQMSKISPKPGSLSTIIRSYKSSVTRESKNIITSFAWQERFYDRVIRNNDELNKTRHYIQENPSHWHLDRNNPANGSKY